MLKLVITISVIAIAAVGVWQKDAIKERWETWQEEREEAELQEEGVLKADGTVEVDAEFDAELNAMLKELNTAENDPELDTLDAEE
jgi:hypothetical protein